MAVSTPKNPGPSWGYRALDWWDAHLPTPIRDAVVSMGGAVAYGSMPAQRAASREYLSAILNRPANHMDGIRHFGEFTHSLLAKLRAGERTQTRVDWADDANRQVGQLMYADEPILLGTFHVGASDLLGFHIKQTGRKVSMIRQRVENSDDIDRLLERSGGMVEVIWVNNEHEVVFALRDALESGKSLAMQCDRIEHASKTEGFDFLGQRRAFPVTIYRLASLYRRPVQFCVALPTGHSRDEFAVYANEGYHPTGSRREDQTTAHKHFQETLNWLESLLKQQPFQWFNFLPLNPLWTEDTNASCQQSAKKPLSGDT